MDVSIAVATFGDPAWVALAESRALPSARRLGVSVRHVHADSLCAARNDLLAQADTEWIVYLDADDELDDGYLEAMATGSADVRAPAVRYVVAGTPQPERLMNVAGHTHSCTADCLNEGNWVVIGACARTQLIRDVGGWRDFPVYEDYDLWLRCHLAGATFEHIPGAVYRAHVRSDSRNRGSLTSAAKHAVHQAIAESNGVPIPA